MQHNTGFKEVVVYHSPVSRQLSPALFDHYLHLLPPDQQAKNSRLRRWQDRHAHLYSRLQLLEGLRNFGMTNVGLDKIRLDTHNRPFISGEIDFNISHTDGYAICAIGKELRIGVDIERHRQTELDDYRISMNEAQWTDILNAKNPSAAFLIYWTKKEAAMKADGRGMGIPPEEVHFEESIGIIEGRRWPLYELKINPGYHAWLACDHPDATVILTEYSPPAELD